MHNLAAQIRLDRGEQFIFSKLVVNHDNPGLLLFTKQQQSWECDVTPLMLNHYIKLNLIHYGDTITGEWTRNVISLINEEIQTLIQLEEAGGDHVVQTVTFKTLSNKSATYLVTIDSSEIPF